MFKINNKGVALIITLAYSLFLILLVFAVLLRAVTYSNVTENNLQRMRAITLAEAAMSYAYWYMATDQNSSRSSEQFWDMDEENARFIFPSDFTDPNPYPNGPSAGEGTAIRVWMESGDPIKIVAEAVY
ncbi:MAG: hypothetical protein ABH848_06250 [Candidatus Omnitrophota bacterium]